MPKRVKIDEYFLDQSSKRRDYLLGLFYSCYIPHGERGILFRSNYEELVEIIKKESKSMHSIVIHPSKSSYWLEANSASYLRSRLREFGLKDKKSERKFPEDIEYMSHFIRAIIDAKASLTESDGRCVKIEIYFWRNNDFLQKVQEQLRMYAITKRGYLCDNHLTYGGRDCNRIRDFIYRDWNLIKRSGLYLKQKRRILEKEFENKPSKMTIRARKRVKKAKGLLEEGLSVGETAKAVGYANHTCFYLAFKNITGKSPTKYIEDIVENPNN